VNVKYKTKNNNTDVIPVFLAIKNQMNTNTSSMRNLRLTETRLCMVWLSGSFVCPLKKMKSVRSDRSAKAKDNNAASIKTIPMLKFETRRNPVKRTRISSIIRKRIFLKSSFNYLIKSFIEK
jgi:hypothetical protein